MNNPATGPYASEEALDSIAIIGMACRFPGANSIEEYWRNLRDGVESISPVSTQDMLDAGVEPTAARDPRRVPVTSTLTGIESFDAGFFDFSAWQAKLTDPQQRFFLECAWESLESAGYDPATCGHVIGVFAGCSMSTYLLFNLYSGLGSSEAINSLQTLISNDKDYLATQVAYKLNLKGPAVNVQTACSTSLVAVHLACQSLLNQECDMALAGGVTVRVPARAGYLYEAGSIVSPDGHCRPFDAGAQGTVFGSGVGIVVLKRLADALADGDAIDAVIKGSAINNDGSSKAGYTAPSEDGQAEVVAEALAIAGVEPRTIQYVEMHGTGTPLGDPIEVAALTRAFRSRARTHPLAPRTCAVGAVKSNFGHLESAAGIAGLLKTALALKHRQIPPTLHFTRPNPAIDFAQTPFYVNTQLATWEAGDTPRRACVSSFGIGGTNAHVVMEQAPSVVAGDAVPRELETGRPYVLPLSARHPAALAALAQAYRDFLADERPGTPVSVRDICWSASLRRKHHPHRLAVVGRTRTELITQLAALGQEGALTPEALATGQRHKVVFVFPGHGSPWIGMGRQLLEREPAFRAALEECDQVMHGYTGWSLITELTRRAGDGSWFERADQVQLALFAIQVGLVALWRSLGVEPDAVVGHGMGEVTAAHVAGVLSLEDAVRIVYHQNRLIERLPGQRNTPVAGLTPDPAGEPLDGHQARIPAADSPQLDSLLAGFREAVRDVWPRKATVPIASTVTGHQSDGTGMDAGYWARHLRTPVLFADAARWLRQSGFDLFVEIGPDPVLLPSIEEILHRLDQPGLAVPTLRRGADEQWCLLDALGALYQAGHPIEWGRLCPQGGRFVRLPAYPWQRRRYWADPPRRTGTALGADDTPAVHPLLGRRLRSALKDTQFESIVSPATAPYLEDHRLCGEAVFPAAAFLEMLWQAAAAWNRRPNAVTDVVLHEALSFGEENELLLQTVLTPASQGKASLQLFSWQQDAAAWRLHVTARIEAARPQDDAERSDLTAVRARCPHELPPAAYYDRLCEGGLECGPRFRALESFWVGDGEAIGRVQLPETLEHEASAYGLHPALLDACLQLIAGTLAADSRRPPAHGEDDEKFVYLPVGFESLHIAIPGQRAGTGHVLVRDEPGGETRTGDVSLHDEHGQLIAKVCGMRLQRVDRARLQRTLQGSLNDWFHELVWQRKPCAGTALSPAGSGENAGGQRRWLILPDRGGVGRALARLLAERGDAATLVFPATSYRHDVAQRTFHICPSRPDDFVRVLSEDANPFDGVIYLWGLDATPGELTTTASLSRDEALICGGALHLTQALARQEGAPSPRLWLVTRGAQSVEAPASPPAVAQAPLWGFGLVAAIEHPDLRCGRVDLDTGSAEDNARTLLAELGTSDGEDQVAFRDSERFAARLVPASSRFSPDGANPPAPVHGPVQLTLPSRGSFDRLTFEGVARRVPGAGEVEIRVRATGLNFRDLLNALGAYPGGPGPLGLECAGEVTAVGEGVAEFQAGDEVVAMAQGCFGTFANVPATFVARKPDRLSFAEAATIPIAFITAYYGLCHQAKISKGDKVLIHSAAGGLGLAAAQLAQRAGAEVFGTAGTDEKRNYLRSLGVQHVMPSRTLDFAAEVMGLTGGRGVDIVLNSLTGEYIPANLSALASGGRFVEVGKTDIWDAGRMRQARSDVRYFAVDLDRHVQSDPAFIGGMLRHLMREFDQGALSPLPQQVFSLQEVTDAFRYMAQAKHIGKIVVIQQDGLSGIDPGKLRGDASYLITGGLGGLGLRVARWMVKRGARHLALVGRSAPSAEAQAAVGELERGGAQVRVITADVSQAAELARALTAIRSTMPPLRGVIHAAGVLDDGIVLRQEWKRFARVFAPKVQGAWNLHAQTSNLPLDFFVLFSSTASLLGVGGQTGYAAANAFLDALAHLRHAQALPALTINWAGWSQAGMAAREAAGPAPRQGVRAIAPASGLMALEQAMHRWAPQQVVAPIDWPKALAGLPPGDIPALLADLNPVARQPPAGDHAAAGRPGLLQRLEATVPNNRRRILTAYLYDQARQFLGLDQASSIDFQKPLSELGLDSLTAIEMRGRLGSDVGQTLPATVLFDHPTIETLVEYLASEVLHLPSDSEPEHPHGDTAALARNDREQDVPDTDITQLSEDEVAASLAEELAAVQALLSGSET